MRILRMSVHALFQSMRHVTALCVLCLLFAAGTARAAVGDVFTVNGINYKVLTTSTVQVENGRNAISYYHHECVIPETVINGGRTYTVTSIGDWAFRECPSLTSVTFPASLTSIGDLAFFNCTGLTSVTLPDSLTSIGTDAFSFCEGVTSITFPVSLTSIGATHFTIVTV